MVHRIVALLAGMIYPFFTIMSQLPEIEFDHITQEQGISDASISKMCQDHQGFLWFGSYNGLNRYDGYDIKVYNHDENNSTSISHNVVGWVFIDYLGNLWVGTVEGLNRYDRNKDQFIRYYHNPDDSTTIGNNIIAPIYEDQNKNLWIGTYGGLSKYNRDADNFTTYKPNPLDSNSISHHIVSHIYHDKNGNYWIGTWGGGLNRFYPDLGVFKSYMHNPNDPNSIGHNNVHIIHQDRWGKYWVGTWGGGLYEFYPESGKFIRFIKIPDDPNPFPRTFTTLYEDMKGNLWLGTMSYGLYIINPNTKRYINYQHNNRDEKSISFNWINHIIKDETGIIWLSTNRGVDKIKFNENSFKNHYYISNKSGKSVNRPIVYSVYEDDDGIVWIGVYDGGLNRYNPGTGEYSYYLLGNNNLNLRTNYIRSICKGIGDILWLGTDDQGLIQFNTKTGFVKRYMNIPGVNNKYDKVVKSLYIDSNNIIWIGLNNTNLVRFNPHTEEFSNIILDPEDYGEGEIYDITSIVQDHNGNLWLSIRQKGLYKYNPVSEEKTVYRVSKDNAKGISNYSVFNIHQQNSNILWIASQNGLNRFDIEKEEFKHYFVQDGLPTNQIDMIEGDSKGMLWLGSEFGITKLNPETERFTNFNEEGHIKLTNVNNGSYYSNKSGTMYFSGLKGFISFNPNKIVADQYLSKIAFTGLKVHKKDVLIGEEVLGKIILHKTINEVDKLELTYKHNNFTLLFAALHYKAPTKNQYKYILEGFDKNWQYIGNERLATYMNVPPGDYKFIVQATNSDGLWNEQGKTLLIEITPPWWSTWWFRIFSMVLLLGVLVKYYFYRVNRIKLKNIELEEIVNFRTKEIINKNKLLKQRAEELNNSNNLLKDTNKKIEDQSEELRTQKDELNKAYEKVLELNKMKDKFISIIGHDLKNPINVVIGFSDLLKMRVDKISKEKIDMYIKNIHQASKKSYKLLENLLDWTKLQGNKIIYNPQNLLLNQIFVENLITLKESYNSKNITVENKIPSDLTVTADLYMIDTIIRNIISNAIKFTNTNGIISCSLKKSQNEGYITVFISDNGIGIPKEKLNELFRIDSSYTREGTNGEAGTGLGLLLCKEFVEKNKGKIWVESEEGAGTTFYFTLPSSN